MERLKRQGDKKGVQRKKNDVKPKRKMERKMERKKKKGNEKRS